LRHIPHGKTLRIILADEATIVWSTNGWGQTNESQTTHLGDLNLWFVDLWTAELARKSQVEFTFFWKREKRWEGRNFRVEVVGNAAGGPFMPVYSAESVPLQEVSDRSPQSPTPAH